MPAAVQFRWCRLVPGLLSWEVLKRDSAEIQYVLVPPGPSFDSLDACFAAAAAAAAAVVVVVVENDG